MYISFTITVICRSVPSKQFMKKKKLFDGNQPLIRREYCLTIQFIHINRELKKKKTPIRNIKRSKQDTYCSDK